MIKYSKMFNDYCKGYVDALVKGKRNAYQVHNWEGMSYFTEGHIMIRIPEDLCPLVTHLDDGKTFAKFFDKVPDEEITLSSEYQLSLDAKVMYVFRMKDDTPIYVDKKLLDTYINIKGYDITFYAHDDKSPIFLEKEDAGVFALILPVKLRK